MEGECAVSADDDEMIALLLLMLLLLVSCCRQPPWLSGDGDDGIVPTECEEWTDVALWGRKKIEGSWFSYELLRKSQYPRRR